MNPGGAQFCPTELPCFLPVLTQRPPISQLSVKIMPDKVHQSFLNAKRRYTSILQFSYDYRTAGACQIILCYLVAEALCWPSRSAMIEYGTVPLK